MASDPRDSGRANVRLHSGDHVCAFHFGHKQRDQLIRPYVEAGLHAGERCVCIVGPGEGSAWLEGLSNGSGAVDASSGELVLAAAHDQPRSATRAEVDRAGSTPGDQPPRVRLITDLGWIEQRQRRPGALAAYERHLETTVARAGNVAMCLWDLERSDVDTVMQLLTTHPKVIVGPQLVTSPWYVMSSERAPARQSGRGRIEGILALATLMLATNDVRTIGALAGVALRWIGSVRLLGIYVRDQGWLITNGPLRESQLQARIEARLVGIGSSGGARVGSGGRWGWAYPLQSPSGSVGLLVVGAESKPADRDLFLTRLVAHKVGAALTSARLHERHRLISRELHHAREALSDATALLDWSAAVRDRLRKVVSAGGGPSEIADAIHDMTGHSVAIEDAEGVLTAWAGPGRPVRCTWSAAQRKRLLARARHAQGPVWDEGRLVAVASRNDQVVGLVSLVGEDGEIGQDGEIGEVGEGEMMAVADGATLLTLELHYQRELAETEVRLGRNLLKELLEGRAADAVVARAGALGYDLTRPLRVVLVDPCSETDPERFFHAVRRAARDTGFGSLLVAHGSGVVILTDAGPPWEPLRTAIGEESGGGTCRIGIGKSCEDVSELPSSLRQAMLALKLQDVFGDGESAVEFEQLGIYRLLVDVAESSDVDRYIKSWLNPLKPLLDYDAVNKSELVATLSTFLECGGRHQAAAKALHVHRSTLKYRIQRIKEISGCDLGDPDTVFNLQLSTRAWRALSGLRP